MSFKTIDAVEEAFEDSKELLFPFDLGTWAKLAFIAVLAGGAGGVNFPGIPSGGSDYSADPGTGSGDVGDLQGTADQDFSNMATGAFTSASTSMAIAGIVVSLFAVVLFFMYISSVFEFIYYQSLIERDVKIVSNFKDNTGNGFRLFSFRLVWITVMILLAGGAFLLVLAEPLAILPIILMMLPLVILVTVISLFVNTFVVLRMLETGEGFIDSARSVYGDLRAEWKEFGVFVVMNLVLGIGVSIAVGTGAMALLIALAIPFGIIGILLYWVSWMLVIPVVAIAGTLFLLGVLIGLVAPTTTFMYYYSIEVYNKLIS
jgi:hypothetical protein